MMLNEDLCDEQWLQESLPAKNGGLELCNAQMLASSALLASAVSMSTLQESIVPGTVKHLEDKSITETAL